MAKGNKVFHICNELDRSSLIREILDAPFGTRIEFSKISEKRKCLHIFERYEADPNSGCWLYNGCLDYAGYGKIRIDNVSYFAHRVSFEEINGPIPDGIVICHKCDTPACINPSHLFAGDHQVNSDDKVFKGRQSRGESRPHSKLTFEEVIKIKELISYGISPTEIANDLGKKVSPSAISRIREGRNWRHV